MEKNIGRVVQIIGPVLDIKFENGEIEIDFDFAGKMLNKLAKIVLKKLTTSVFVNNFSFSC